MHPFSDTIATVNQPLVPENNLDAPRCMTHLRQVLNSIGRANMLGGGIKVRATDVVISNIGDGVDGKKVQIAGWIRERKDGSGKYMSLKFSEPKDSPKPSAASTEEVPF